MPTSDLTITDHRGGLNEDAPSTLADNELVTANNIEFWTAKLGERRLGCVALDLTSSGLTAKNTICHLSQWFPTNVPTLAEYLAAAVTVGGSIVFARRDTGGTWHAVTASDTVDFTALAFQMRTLPFRGHVHWTYKSDQNRSHVLVSAGTMRRSGLAAPGAPTAVDTGTAGIFGGVRYYRCRAAELSGTTVLRRSEPGATLTFTPAGTKNGATITKPGSMPGEGETHWEIEASEDNSNWYRLSQVLVATSTYTDQIAGPKTYPANRGAGAPVSTDGTSITYVKLSNQAAQLNLTGAISNGTYSDGTNIAGRGWIWYDSTDTYIAQSASNAWAAGQKMYASPDVATVLEANVVGGTAQNYAASGTLSDPVGMYLLLPSFKYAIVEGDRLVYASHWSDTSLYSQVGWTPVTGDPGVGNDERAPIVDSGGSAITMTAQLDNYLGGGLTGLANGTFGIWFGFKWSRIYSAQRTRSSSNPYEIGLLTDTRGAIDGSVIQASDSRGNPVVYFLDPEVGPCQLTMGGTVKVIRGLTNSWPRVNQKATNVVACGTFYKRKGQLMWDVSVDGGNSPTFGIMIDTNYLKDDEEGYLRGGITLYDGKKAQGLCMASLTYTDGNLTTMFPFIGCATPDFVLRADAQGIYKDNGTSYTAKIVGKPRYAAGLNKLWEAFKAAALFTSNAVGSAAYGLIRDQNASNDATKVSAPKTLAPSPRNEPEVLIADNDVNVSEAGCIQVVIQDGAPDSPWNCQRIDLVPSLDGDA
jgi:hypothetical protein